jgi:hypothetical protein
LNLIGDFGGRVSNVYLSTRGNARREAGELLLRGVE